MLKLISSGMLSCMGVGRGMKGGRDRARLDFHTWYR